MSQALRTKEVKPDGPKARGQRGNAAVLNMLRHPGRGSKLLLGTIVWVAFFGGWLYVATFTGIPRILLPSPHEVVAAAGTMFMEDGFAWDILASAQRIFFSFVLTSLVGVPLGIAMGASRRMEAAFNPFVSAWRYLPAAAFVPVLLMWLGTGEAPKMALLVLGVIFFQITIIMDMTRAIPQPLIETGMTLGASRLQVLWKIIVPWVLPDVIVALRQTIAIGWTYLVIAEIIAATDGIGAMMMRSQRFMHTDNILFGIAVIGILGLLTDIGFQWVHRVLFSHARPGL
jgi:NitT/TauT family transport system permease protein